jgi:hypothetical protein
MRICSGVYRYTALHRHQKLSTLNILAAIGAVQLFYNNLENFHYYLSGRYYSYIMVATPTAKNHFCRCSTCSYFPLSAPAARQMRNRRTYQTILTKATQMKSCLILLATRSGIYGRHALLRTPMFLASCSMRTLTTAVSIPSHFHVSHS